MQFSNNKYQYTTNLNKDDKLSEANVNYIQVPVALKFKQLFLLHEEVLKQSTFYPFFIEASVFLSKALLYRHPIVITIDSAIKFHLFIFSWFFNSQIHSSQHFRKRFISFLTKDIKKVLSRHKFDKTQLSLPG